MKPEMFLQFQGKFVKLVFKKNDFTLYGIIDLVYEDALLFTTRQKTSLISFDAINEVTPKEERYKEGQ